MTVTPTQRKKTPTFCCRLSGTPSAVAATDRFATPISPAGKIWCFWHSSTAMPVSAQASASPVMT